MAEERERIAAILGKLQKSAVLTDDELRTLQSTVDLLEARASKSHHDTTSHHHTSRLLDVLDDIKELGQFRTK